MRIYKIIVGTNTKKNKFISHIDKIVKSDLDNREIQSFFQKKYEGFTVLSEEITTNVFEIKNDGKKEIIQKEDCEIRNSKIVANYKNKYYSDELELVNYLATIESSRIDFWEEYNKELGIIRNKEIELREKLKERFLSQFPSIASVQSFNIYPYGVNLEFRPCDLDFPLFASKNIKKNEDLPF